ncbi:MAG: hypothetical protein H6713_09970 [Myxococcales bacterium]|nr:hypothetical protein [Myxococcales bacterium]MCB9750313.1 hypothetical protein [Myxococcales bacterium]
MAVRSRRVRGSRRARRLAALVAALVGVTVTDARAAPGGKAEAPERPRLVIAGGPVIGPHVGSEEDCRPNGPSIYCENTGGLLGVGLNLELRGQLYGLLYGQLRGVLVGNVRGADGVYSGLATPGVGLGLHARRVFLRAEYLLMLPFGDDRYRSPFASQPDSTVALGYHAGMLSGGARFYVRSRLAIELWGGLVVGPRVERVTERAETTGANTQVSFMAGLNLSFDAIPGKPKASRAPTVQPQPAQRHPTPPNSTQPVSPATQHPTPPYSTQPVSPATQSPATQPQPVPPATTTQPQPMSPTTQPQPVSPAAQPQPAQPVSTTQPQPQLVSPTTQPQPVSSPQPR